MPRSFTIDEIFGGQPLTEDEEQPVSLAGENGQEADRSYSIDEIFQLGQPEVTSEAPRPTLQPERPIVAQGIPLAPADVFGLPADLEEPSGVTRFFEELPGVVGDVAHATKGVIRETLLEDMTPEERSAGKRLFDDIREIQGPRAVTQGAMQFSKTLQGVILRPLAFAGIEGADETADQAKRIVQALGQENSRRAATSLIAQVFGETTGQISENVISSLTEQYMGGRFLRRARVASSPTRAAMIYTGLSAGNSALTEGTDLGFEGAKRWGYAGTVGALNSAFIGAGGALARRLGLETVEEAMFRPMLTSVLANSGVKQALTTLMKGIGGAALEGGEELGTEFSTGITKAIFEGEPEGALDRAIAKVNDKGFQKNVITAGLTGVAARGAVGAVRNLGSALERAKEMLPGSMTELAETVQIAPKPGLEGEILSPGAPAPEAAAVALPGVDPSAVGAPQTASPGLKEPWSMSRAEFTEKFLLSGVVHPSLTSSFATDLPPMAAHFAEGMQAIGAPNPGKRGEGIVRGFKREGATFSTVNEYKLPAAAEVAFELTPGEVRAGAHEALVTRAVKAGKPVPAHVLAEYPHLAAEIAVPVTAPTAAPQEAPLAPAPEAAAVALPGVEPAAGVPPAEAPAVPPGVAPEAAGEPTAAPPVATPLSGFQLANAPMEQLARSLGRGESYYSPATRGLREAAILAVEARVPERALEISRDIIENKRLLSSVEEVGLGLRVKQVSSRLEQNRARMNEATDETEIRTLAAEANNLGEDFDILKEALQLGSADPAKLLAYKRWMFPDDLTEEGIVARLKTSRKSNATPKDKTFAKDVAAKHSEVAQKLTTARAKQKEAIAKEALVEMKKEGPPSEEVGGIIARIRELMEAGCNLE